MRTCKCGNPIPQPNRYRCKACEKKRRQEERQAHQDAGLCITCGGPASPPYKNCENCRAKIREAGNDRRSRLIKTGLCPQCGIRPLTGKSYCQECLNRRNAQYMIRYAKRKEQGLCIDCRSPTDPDSIFCPSCRAKRNLENKNQREKKGNKRTAKNRDGHCCRICGKTTALCIHHIDGQGERNSITKVWQKANDDLDNLITLCRGCHGAITRFINHNPQLASRLVLTPQIKQRES